MTQAEAEPVQPFTVLVSENLAERMPYLADRYPQVRFLTVPMEGGEMRSEYRDAHVMFRSAMSAELFDEILLGAPDLAFVQISAAGFDWMGGPILRKRIAEGMQVTRSANSYNVPIAEYVMGMMLSMARHLPTLLRAQEDHEWVRTTARDFAGSTVGVFGTGAIGREVAWRSRSLGAQVVGVSRSGVAVEGFEEVVTSAEVAGVLPRCDYVVLAMPLTTETRHMFGAEQFARMKSSAVIVNVGRGALLDDDALIEALESEQIAGAVLDAFVTEPLPADSPLWSTKNAVITPHTSFRSDGNTDRLCADFCENLDYYLKGEPLVGTMKEPTLGY
ncbi:D-2-hydroxyacid dehydrogenase [Bogoriella caseilytica]|uniref:Phosphoglycerate dehydrogenase-like enzyme n=1 Tax=Bogoriella caseilytica TaxID=56055 RepID=A0A3N2BDI4_9MICO|nr:D-2-hydroxyacid dehydrogenase [Bogoriella caseilytica]ROR73306.1 phosphoglycerate dehydrogenase-like enzyme [Bogoriella caseilytica]